MKTEFLRFAITGVISNLINFLIYISAYVSFESIVVASSLGYLGGLSYSYFLGRVWVFNSLGRVTSKEIFMFFLVYALGGVGMVTIIHFSDVTFGLDYRLCWFIGASFAVVNNFIGSKFFVFNIK